MITTQRPIRLKQLIKASNHIDYIKESMWCNSSNFILTNKSWTSLYIIFKLFIEVQGEKPIVLVPEYYCNDTLSHLRNVAEIEYYKLNEDLSININACSKLIKGQKHYDFLIGVHFFGKEFDFNNIKTQCKNKNVFFIEDAVHVAISYGKIGKFGDFCIYSPWKIYGLYDGAILIVNCNEALGMTKEVIISRLKEIVNSFPVQSITRVKVWRCKKVIQKFLPNIKRNFILKSYETHSSCYESSRAIDDVPTQISEYSKNIIDTITEEEMKLLVERKYELSASIEDYLSKKYKSHMLFEDNCMPYAIVLDLPDASIKRKIAQKIGNIGQIAFEWPELPQDLPVDSNSNSIKRKLLFIMLHDGISLRRVSNALDYKSLYRTKNSNEYSIDLVDEQIYEKFTNRFMTPILQSKVYGEAKRDVQGWKRSLWKVTANGTNYAVFTLLTKYGIVHRINRGPVFADNIDSEEKIKIINIIKKKFSGIHGILFFAPSIERSGYNINALLAMGFNYKKTYFGTGFIDLTNDVELLHKNLSSKWRNCLRNAEKRGLHVFEVNDDEVFLKLLKLHSQDKKERGYQDSGDEITKYLYEQGSLIGLYIRNEKGDIISFILCALHGCTATYYIGWSNDEGYKSNASRLLLWKEIVKLKGMGIRYFDLGGIDHVYTKGVAEFKEETGCEIYDYVGEYLAL